jgi:predicted RNase H-like HicB family nuclease
LPTKHSNRREKFRRQKDSDLSRISCVAWADLLFSRYLRVILGLLPRSLARSQVIRDFPPSPYPLLQHRIEQKDLEKISPVQHFHRMNYHVTLVESEEGFAVWCDDLPGCNSQGATREEALENIRIAIDEYLAAQPEIAKRFGTRITREEVSV